MADQTDVYADTLRRRRPIDAAVPTVLRDPYAAAAAPQVLGTTDAERAAAVGDTSTQAERAIRSGFLRFASEPAALYGAGANLVTPGAGDAALESAAGLQRRATETGPRVQTVGDVHSVGDALALVRNQALMGLPDIATTLAGGGIGGAAVKGLARRAGASAAERLAARQALKSGAEVVAPEAVERASARLVPAALRAAEPATRAATAAGTVAGQYPSVVAGSVEGAPDANGNLVGGLKGASAEDTGKILLGDLGAAALGAAPEFRLLSRIGGPAAAEAIQKNAQAILPRVAREAAKQGALGAGLGAAQTAAQFAAHKWVNDNVDLMSPAAFQSYVDSAVAGGALGAGLGGAVEGAVATAARARSSADAVGGGLDKLRASIRENLEKAAAAKDAAFAKTRAAYDRLRTPAEGTPVEEPQAEGQPVDAGPAKTPVESAQELGRKVGETGAAIHRAATDMFDKLQNALSTDGGRGAVSRAFSDAANAIKDKFDTEPFKAGVEATLKSYQDALNRAKTPAAQADVQRAYGEVLKDHITDEAPASPAASFADNLERLDSRERLDDATDNVLSRLTQRFESGEADALSPSDRSPAQNPAKMGSKLQDQLATVVPIDSPIWSFPEAMKPIMASAEKLFTGDALTARDHQNLDILRQYAPEKVEDWTALGPEIAKVSKGLDSLPEIPEHEAISDGTLAERLVNVKPGTDEHATLQGELKSRLLRDGAVFTENQSTAASRAKWATKDPTRNANTVGIGTTKIEVKGGRTIERQQALQLDNLISKKLAEQPGIGPRAGMLQVLGDLELAGIKVDPKTITPGVFYSTKGGEKFSLSPKDAAEIRRGLVTPADTRGVTERAPAAPGEAAPARDIAVDRPDEVATGAEGNFAATPERVPREAPPAGETPRGDARTPTQTGISSVQLKPSPYEAIVSRARQQREAATTSAARGKALHEAGVEIGTAELRKERDAGTINERRFVAEMKRLNDFSSGLSRKYLRDAAGGKFDSAKVRETAPDTEQPVPQGELRREANDALERAFNRMQGTEGKVTRRQVEDAVEVMQQRADAGESFSPKERSFISAARDAGHKIDLGDQRTPAAKARDAAVYAKRPTSEARRLGLDESKDASERQIRDQPENPRSKAKPADEQVMDDLTRRTKAQEAKRNVDDPESRKAIEAAQRAKRAEEDVKETNRLYDTEAVDAGVESALREDGAHDYAAEEHALNATLAKAGIKERVTVSALPRTSSKRGDYHPGTHEVRIHPDLHGAERLEVLAHELGHHIIRSELARAMRVPMKSIESYSMSEVFDRMQQHQPELHAAINKDFEKWSEAHGDLNERYTTALASRKAFHSAEATRARNATTLTQREVAQLSSRDMNYLHSFEEYVADQISRALTYSDGSPIGRFFKGIADKLKIAYDTLFKRAGGKEYKAAPSVEKWIKSLFDRTTLDVSQALGESVPRSTARTATEAAFHAEAATHPPAEPPRDGGPPRGGSPAPSPTPQGLKALVKFFRYRLPADTRAILDRALGTGKSLRALERIYADRPGALKAMRNPEHGLEARAAFAYLAWRQDKFKGGPRMTSAFRNLADDLLSIANLSGRGALAERIFNDIENGRIESMVKTGRTYDVAAREAAYRGKAQAVFNEVSKAYAAVRRPLAKVFDSSISRMRDTGVPAIRRIGAQLQRHTGEAGEDPGMLPAITHVTDRFMRASGKALEALNDVETLHVLTALQRQEDGHHNPKVDAAVKAVRKLFDEFHMYARDAGVDVGHREKYFPVVMDIKNAADATKLKTLLSDPKFESRIREVMGSWKGPSSARRAPNKAPIGDLIDRLVEAAEGMSPRGREDFGGGPPAEWRAQNYRLLDFIYKLGDASDKATFAALQSKSPADIFVRYVQPMVRQAEFERRFGGGRYGKLLEEAKKQGATDAQIAQAQAAVDGAMGRVGTDGSPVLKTLLGEALAGKIAKPGTRRFIAYTQAYQNARLLTLSVLSSLVDPMGIAVRTGGDFKTAWQGFKVGMKSLVDKQTKAELNAMLQSLGSADDFLANDILSSNFGRADGGARKINEFLFKVNGLASWTKTTRFMALKAAHGFLLKHAAGDNATSKRYLDELGVRPGDIERNADGNVRVLTPAERAAGDEAGRSRDDRVRSALLRFVDEAVLRPTSQQAPNWFADPYVGLVTQYKHFAYAIQDQIGRRIVHELRRGNNSVLAPAMAYLPIIIMAEMLRGAVQYGANGNPNRKDWGPEEYTTYALDRSGLLGPKLSFQADALQDTKYGSLPGSSFLGPTFQQGRDIIRATTGRGSAGRTLEEALPGEALYKHWNDGEKDARAAA